VCVGFPGDGRQAFDHAAIVVFAAAKLLFQRHPTGDLRTEASVDAYHHQPEWSTAAAAPESIEQEVPPEFWGLCTLRRQCRRACLDFWRFSESPGLHAGCRQRLRCRDVAALFSLIRSTSGNAASVLCTALPVHALPGCFPLGESLSVDRRRPHQAQENNGRHPEHGSLSSFMR
jgi:hypothetical protein